MQGSTVRGRKAGKLHWKHKYMLSKYSSFGEISWCSGARLILWGKIPNSCILFSIGLVHKYGIANIFFLLTPGQTPKSTRRSSRRISRRATPRSAGLALLRSCLDSGVARQGTPTAVARRSSPPADLNVCLNSAPTDLLSCPSDQRYARWICMGVGVAGVTLGSAGAGVQLCAVCWTRWTSGLVQQGSPCVLMQLLARACAFGVSKMMWCEGQWPEICCLYGLSRSYWLRSVLLNLGGYQMFMSNNSHLP